MSEAKFKKQVQAGFVAYSNHYDVPLHWQLHEDSDSVGIPDVSYGILKKNGWIEAKWDARLPSPGGKYNPHFEAYQEAWLVARGQAGAGCHLVHGFSDGHLIMSYEGLMRRRPGMTMMDVADLPGTALIHDKFDKDSVHILLHGMA